MRHFLSTLLAFLVVTATVYPQPRQEVVSGHFRSSAASPAAFVQEIDNGGNLFGGSNTFNIVFGSNVGAGDTVVCMIGWTFTGAGGATAVTSLIDGNTASYSAIDTNVQTSVGYGADFILANSAGGTGSKTITVLMNGTLQVYQFECQEAAHVDTTSGTGSIDVHGTNKQSSPGTGTNAVIANNAGSSQTTTGADYLFAGSFDSETINGTWTAGTSPIAYNLATTNNGSSHASEYFVQTVGASGSEGTFTYAGGNTAITLSFFVALKP